MFVNLKILGERQKDNFEQGDNKLFIRGGTKRRSTGGKKWEKNLG